MEQEEALACCSCRVLPSTPSLLYSPEAALPAGLFPAEQNFRISVLPADACIFLVTAGSMWPTANLHRDMALMGSRC